MADRAKVTEQLQAMQTAGPQVAIALGGDVRFDANGRRHNPPLLLMQWQGGVPLTIYPDDVAVAKPLKFAT